MYLLQYITTPWEVRVVVVSCLCLLPRKELRQQVCATCSLSPHICPRLTLEGESTEGLLFYGLLHRLFPNRLGDRWPLLVWSHSSCLSLWRAKHVAPSARLCLVCAPQAMPLDLLLKPGLKPACDSLDTSISRHAKYLVAP